LIVWRGHRLTGYGPIYAGEWIWLFSWPTGLFSCAFFIGSYRIYWLPILLAALELLSAALCVALGSVLVRRFGIADGPDRGRASMKLVWALAAANSAMRLWIAVPIVAFGNVPVLLSLLANVLICLGVAGHYQASARSIPAGAQAWTHFVGLLIPTLVGVALILSPLM
jgi:hypothetical protein